MIIRTRSLLLPTLALLLTACGLPIGGDQGSPSNPVPLGNYPVTGHAGSVGVNATATSGSYYKVDGISPGGTYNVNLTNTTGNLFLYVYDDNTYSISSVLCYNGGLAAGNRTCSTSFPTPTGTSLYVQVLNASPTAASFTISVN